MCVVGLTRGDGTLFDATSIQEEDIIEICIQLGQAHPKGVFQYLAVKSVILFQSTEEILVTMHGSSKQWHSLKKLLDLGCLPPLPPMCGPLWQQGMENCQAPSLQPLIGVETLTIPQWPPTRWEDPMSITGEPWGPCGCWTVVAHGGSPLGGHSQGTKCTPRDPPPTPWGNVDDWEVTFLRGGGWEPRGQPLWSHAPTKPDEGWKPRGQPLWPPAPTQPDEDVGCLINTLVTILWLWLGNPHINTLSGKATLGKTEVYFKQWYHEVQCIKDLYPESVVK